ncbi:hypothetical protein GCM10028811_18400 [Uliginosibacterium sediminicola]
MALALRIPENHFMYRILACLLCALALPVQAQSAPAGENDPAVWAARRQRAESLRKDASKITRAADAARAEETRACRPHFFENACKDAARDRWIEKVNQARAMQMEAAGLEQALRAYELSVREQEISRRAAKREGQVLQAILNAPPSAAHAEKPAAKPLVPRQAVSSAAPKHEDRAEREREAAARAAQARKDAERYAARARAKAAQSSSAAASK